MAEIPAVSVAGKDRRTCAAFVPRSNQGYTDASAPVAQGIERAPPEREVAGSIPAGRIISRSVLEASAGSWRGRRFSGADYADTMRGDLNQRLRRLGLESTFSTRPSLSTACAARHPVDLLSRLVDEDETVLASEVVRFELLAGVRDDELEALEQFFWALSWVPVDEGVSRTAASLARKHRTAPADLTMSTTSSSRPLSPSTRSCSRRTCATSRCSPVSARPTDATGRTTLPGVGPVGAPPAGRASRCCRRRPARSRAAA
jgi:hypothetical protein